jgi:hypothetical protein
MTWNLLITNGCGRPVREYVKSLLDFGHLFGNSISPKGITILAVELKGFFNGPWYCWMSLLSILVLILMLVSAGRPGRDAESV